MNTKRRRLFALLLGLVLALSFVMLAACDNGEEEEPQGPVYTIGLSAQVLEVERYGRGELTATVYKDGVATTDSVTWSSANTAVATVSGGVVVAVGEGSTQITAAAQGQTAACTVTVTDEGIVPQLVVADTTIPLTYRADDPGYYDILAEVKFYDYDTSDAVISYEAVTSDTSDPSVIELSPEGRVTAKKMGRATVLVSATWNGYTCTEVPVSVVVYDDIEVRLLDEEDVALTPGETSALYTWAGTVEGNTFTKSETFGAKVLKKAEEVADATVEWQTSDAAVVAIASHGIVSRTRHFLWTVDVFNQSHRQLHRAKSGRSHHSFAYGRKGQRVGRMEFHRITEAPSHRLSLGAIALRRRQRNRADKIYAA